MKKSHLSILIVILIVVLDQWSKLWIKTHMLLGERYQVASWFYINFQENEGMAFSMSLPGAYGKILLSLFRVVAVALLIYYIRLSIKEKGHWGFIAALSMILAGAIGNIIDGAFYGLFFSDSTYHVAHLVSPGHGYTGFMLGHVVDMLYFPLWEGILPSWIPVYGGQFFMFFGAVFNVADAAITGGVIVIAIFSWLFFREKSPEPKASVQSEPDHLSGRNLP